MIKKNKIHLVLMLLILLTIEHFSYSYNGPEHTDIGEHAKDNYVAYVTAHSETSVGGEAVKNYWSIVSTWIVHEDDWANWLEHFWNPDNNKGLPGQKTALKRAQEFWDNKVLPEYANGDYNTVYEYIGRIAHLIMDMGVPAHVLLDPHGSEEYYEKDYITNLLNKVPEIYTNNIVISNSLESLMRNLAEISDDFDCNDRNGEVKQGSIRNKGFTHDDGAEIARKCYPGAISAVGGFLKLFFDTVKPTVTFLKPIEGEIHSGLKGIPLIASAKSFVLNFQGGNKIKSTKFYYSEFINPLPQIYYSEFTNPLPQNWNFLREVTIPENNKYKTMWTEGNYINKEKIWVQARSVDKGECESLPVKLSIKVDSTKPQVKNFKPVLNLYKEGN